MVKIEGRAGRVMKTKETPLPEISMRLPRFLRERMIYEEHCCLFHFGLGRRIDTAGGKEARVSAFTIGGQK